MNEKNNGGPAFPIIHDVPAPSGAARAISVEYGMTLRDYFAAQALSTAVGYSDQDLSTWTPQDFARHAYALADAMLAERAK